MLVSKKFLFSTLSFQGCKLMIRVEDSQIGGTWKKLVFCKGLGHQSAYPKEMKYEKIGYWHRYIFQVIRYSCCLPGLNVHTLTLCKGLEKEAGNLLLQRVKLHTHP